MSFYTITHTNGTSYTTVAEGTVDSSLGISLIGQNYHNYGQLIANNFLHLLEHQAADTPPVNPQAGQLWWNTDSKVLSFFDGSRFKPCISSSASGSSPITPKAGDQWWNTDTNQLNIFDGVTWTTVGPLYAKGTAFTGVLPQLVTDTVGNKHTIATLKVDEIPISIFSNDSEFTLATPIGGMSKIVKGISLPPSSSLFGTAANSVMLNGVAAEIYVRKNADVIELDGSLFVNGLDGITVGGLVSPLTIKKDSFSNFEINAETSNVSLKAGEVEIRCNNVLGTVTVSAEPSVDSSVATKFYVDHKTSGASSGSTEYTDSSIEALVDFAILNTLRKLSTAIKNDSNFGDNVYAQISTKADKVSPTLSGEPRSSTPPLGDNSTRIATTAFINDSIVGLDLLNIKGVMVPASSFGSNALDIGTVSNRFRNIFGTAIKAKYADLAETYLSDSVYLPGTVVVFGGKQEITVSDQVCDTRIAGIVSTNPAYLMNDQKEGIPVALTGKVPCKVYGPVKKGDLLVNSEFAGVAKVLSNRGSWAPGCTIGKSLETDVREGIRDIMVAVGRF